MKVLVLYDMLEYRAIFGRRWRVMSRIALVVLILGRLALMCQTNMDVGVALRSGDCRFFNKNIKYLRIFLYI